MSLNHLKLGNFIELLCHKKGASRLILKLEQREL